jgi:hypothetical protein
MIKKSYIVFVFFVCCTFLSNAQQQVTSNLSVEIKNGVSEYFLSDSADNRGYMSVFPVTVTQTINLQDYQDKQIKLYLQNLPYFHQILFAEYYKNLTVFSLKNEIDTIPLHFQFNGDTLFVDTDNNTTNFVIQYRFQSDYFLRTSEGQTLIFFQPQLCNWHSWFFAAENMKIENAVFNVPDKEIYFWANNTLKITDFTYKTDLSKITKNNVSFYIIKKSFYNNVSFKEKNVLCNFYLLKNVIADTTEVIRNNISDRKISYIAENKFVPQKNTINQIKNAIKQIVNIFDNKKNIKLNVVDAYLTIKDFQDNKFLWGNATEISNNEYWLLLDTSMLKNINFHEFIHPFFDNNLSKNDIAPFFFNESMIEYIAVWLSYKSEKQRDSVFNRKNEFYKNLDVKDLSCTSIFKVTENKYNMDGTRGGDAAVVYEKTPYKIHKFAKNIGNERFISILSKFYKSANRKGYASFSDFEKIMKQNGVSDKQWNDFIKDL